MRRTIVGALASVLLITLGLKIRAQNPSAGQSATSEVIEVTAKKYEFSPAEIRVKKGAKVRLKIHSVDEDHGMKLSLYPEGSKDKSTPGLVFDNPQDNGKVDKGRDQILEFVAERAGTYEFRCAVVCGIHHGRMKGTLVVEE
jgi:cytochrome c oxidase subunit 2